jgi:DhnA family fructose-bisphosphate aldolase class Ia
MIGNGSPLRLRRLVDPGSGRALLLSFTAGMEVGVTPDLADLPSAIGELAGREEVTGVVIRAGTLPSLFARFPSLPFGIVVDLLGGTWLTPEMERPSQICSLEHAVRSGADGVLVTISLGGPDESSRLRLCGQIARQCADWGMPLIVRIDTMALSGPRQYSAVLSGQGARMAYELGADLVVVNYSGSRETFADALRGIDIPVLFGGGPHMETDDALLESIDAALESGASGVALSGPMFWQNGHPSVTLDRLASRLFAENRKQSKR